MSALLHRITPPLPFAPRRQPMKTYKVILYMFSFPMPILAWCAILQMGLVLAFEPDFTHVPLAFVTSAITLLIAVIRVVSDWYKDKRREAEIQELNAQIASAKLESNSTHAQMLLVQNENKNLWHMLDRFQGERESFRHEQRTAVSSIREEIDTRFQLLESKNEK